MPVQAEEAEDFKSKYKNLKRKLKILVYENECFQEELGKANRALLRVRQDKNFLLEQLLHYQQPPASSSDSDLTDNSDNESNVTVQSVKRKRFGDGITGTSANATMPVPPSAAAGNSTGGRPSSSSAKPASKPSSTSSKQHCPTASSSGSTGGGGGGGSAAIVPAASKKRTLLSVNRAASKPANKNSGRQRRGPHKPLTVVGTSNAAGHRNAAQGSGSSGSARGTSDPDAVGGAEERELSREEVERHLLSRQTIADFHTPVSLTLPHQLFSDNLMDGDLLEEIETSPSNLEEDMNADNYE